jgi:hypothetical protein
MRSLEELSAYLRVELMKWKPRVRLRVYEDGSTTILGLDESERARLGDALFEELDQALFEMEEGYGS